MRRWWSAISPQLGRSALDIPPFLVPSVGLPPISSSYTLHSFTSPAPPSPPLSSLWPPPSSFPSLSLSLRFSPRVSIPLSCSPLVRVRVLIQPVAGLLTNPSLSFIFLTSCSLRPLRAASSSLSLHSSFLLPPPLALPCSTARQAKTSILSPIASFHGMGRDTYPWEQRRAPIIFFASGTEEKIRRQGTSNVARYGRELSSSVCDGRYNTFYLSAEGGGWRLRAIISWNVLVERARLLFEKYSFWFAGRISRMDLFVENNCRYFFSFFLVRLLSLIFHSVILFIIPILRKYFIF